MFHTVGILWQGRFFKHTVLTSNSVNYDFFHYINSLLIIGKFCKCNNSILLRCKFFSSPSFTFNCSRKYVCLWLRVYRFIHLWLQCVHCAYYVWHWHLLSACNRELKAFHRSHLTNQEHSLLPSRHSLWKVISVPRKGFTLISTHYSEHRRKIEIMMRQNEISLLVD